MIYDFLELDNEGYPTGKKERMKIDTEDLIKIVNEARSVSVMFDNHNKELDPHFYNALVALSGSLDMLKRFYGKG